MNIKESVMAMKKWLALWWGATILIGVFTILSVIVPTIAVIGCIIMLFAYALGIILPMYISYNIAKLGKDVVDGIAVVLVGWFVNTIITGIINLVASAITGGYLLMQGSGLSNPGIETGMMMGLASVAGFIIGAIISFILDIVLAAIGYFVYKATSKK